MNVCHGAGATIVIHELVSWCFIGELTSLLLKLFALARCDLVDDHCFILFKIVKKGDISGPQNFVHEVHVGFDSETGEFSVSWSVSG